MEIVYPSQEKGKAIYPMQIFAAGLKLWRKNFFTLGGIYLLIYLPVIAVNIALFIKYTDGTNALPLPVVLAAFAVDMLAGAWMAVTLTLAVSKMAKDIKTGVMENLKDAGGRFLLYLGTMALFFLLIWSIAMAGMLIAALLGGTVVSINKIWGAIVMLIAAIPPACALVYFIIRLSLGGVVCILEKKRPIASLKESHALVKNYVTPVVGEYFLMILVSIFVLVPLLFLVAIMKNTAQPDILPRIYQYIAGIFFVPFATCVYIVLYNKLKEATA